MPQLTQLVFSWDRPLQLWGLVKSMFDNTDLEPNQIRCICKFTDEGYRSLYQTVGKELGCRITYQGDRSLWDSIAEQTQDCEFVSLAVDDMMFFNRASYNRAVEIMRRDSEICLWSWRIGADLQPSDKLHLHREYWSTPHATAGRPYDYIFHSDGSLYRREDFEYWMHLIPKQRRATFNLNRIEAHLAGLPGLSRPNLGNLHAGRLTQACVTWRINKVSGPYGSKYYETGQTKPSYLRRVFEEGGRLDYSSLYGRSDWLLKLNAGWPQLTHVFHSEEAADLFTTLIGKRK